MGGRPGHEKLEWWAQIKNNFEWLLHLPELSGLNLAWEEVSDREPNLWEPHWHIELSNTNTRREAIDTAHLLGVWQVALDSVRTVTEN